MGGFSIWHWLIVLVIVVLVFGTKRLKNLGKDLGDVVKGFKQGVRDDDKPPAQLHDLPPADVKPPAAPRRDDMPADSASRRNDDTSDDRTPR